MTYFPLRQALDAAMTWGGYRSQQHHWKRQLMLRPEHRRDSSRISDRELGIAAFLLLFVLLLTVIIVPGIA